MTALDTTSPSENGLGRLTPELLSSGSLYQCGVRGTSCIDM